MLTNYFFRDLYNDRWGDPAHLKAIEPPSGVNFEALISKFQKASTTYQCHRCSKRTRETGSDESAYSLCKKCFLICEEETK